MFWATHTSWNDVAVDWYGAEAEVESVLMAKLDTINQIEDVKLRSATLEGALMAAMRKGDDFHL